MNSALQFNVSPYAPFMQETKVTLGNGIQLHVEIGGNPEHPTILLVMGLGAQMLFWPDFFCKSLIDQGFRVIRLTIEILVYLQKFVKKENDSIP